MRRLAIAMMLSSAAISSVARGECKVLDAELQGRYEGECVNGFAHGEGVATGSIAEYRGAFREGRKHGRGVKTWIATGDTYEGAFAEDRRHGTGTYRWGPRTPWAGESYTGDYRADRRHGTGTYTWSSGDRYVGSWEDDRQSGPPTAMQRQRTRAVKGVLDAIGTPGARVCGSTRVGIAHLQAMEGVVTEVMQDRLLIRVTKVGERAAARDDVFFWDVALNWRPCR